MTGSFVAPLKQIIHGVNTEVGGNPNLFLNAEVTPSPAGLEMLRPSFFQSVAYNS